MLTTGGFRLYLLAVGDRNPLLGAFGGGIVVMSWAYLLSLALLVGAELNAVLEVGRASRQGERRRDPERVSG